MNRFRNYVLMAAGFAVLVMVIGVFSAGPAIAQAVRAALVSNVDDPGRIPYKTEVGFDGDCAGNGCFGVGPKVPAGKRLVITNVTGQIISTVPGGAPLLLSIYNVSTGVRVPLTYSGQSSVGNFFVFNQQVLVVLDAGYTPGVTAFTRAAGQTDGYVDLSGYLLDCMAAPCAAIQP